MKFIQIEVMKMKHLAALVVLTLMSIVSCKKADPLPVFDDVNAFYSKNATEGSAYTINVDNHNDTIITPLGTQFVFPVGAFSKSGDINLSIKEITTPVELVLTNAPNNIDSTFNQNPVIFEIKAEGTNLIAGKSYKVSLHNNGDSYSRLSTGGSFWRYDNSVSDALTEPDAGENVPSVIFNSGNRSIFTFDKLGWLSLSKNPFGNDAKKTKVAVKIYGFANSPTVDTYVILKDKNAVNKAKRISDSEFLTDSVNIGEKLYFVTICYNQNKKYLGLSNAVVADSVNVPISLFDVNSEDEIKNKINNYIK